MFATTQKTEKKMIIKASDIKVSLGHPQKFTGTGIHKDKRLRRQSTRSAQIRKALEC